MKRMLFNATQAEELRVAIADGQHLIDLDVESYNKEQKKGNIYKGIISRIEPALEAVFIDYGVGKQGFLPFKEIHPDILGSTSSENHSLKTGQEIIVQVEKEERGNKGAALTTYISLAGRYLVLMTNNPRAAGVSRRIEGQERQDLKEAMSALEFSDKFGVIVRTAGIGRTTEELQWDLNYLQQLWQAIEQASQQQSAPFLIYLESSLVIRAIRDYFQTDIKEILVDTEDTYEQVKNFMSSVMPDHVPKIQYYSDDSPLFSRFQVEHQIESACSRQVNLPSGGALIIDHTEALVSIDVNSGRSNKSSAIEETAFLTNSEAAEEIGRQLRLRDLGGLIVIDFIDMSNPKHIRDIERIFKDSLKIDRARIQIGKISRFGLLELSRQRLRPALAESNQITCPRCSGTGNIRSTESASLHTLRILEEEAVKENTAVIHCQIPIDVATFLLNEKRIDISQIETRHHVSIFIIPNRYLETPHYDITRWRNDQLDQAELEIPSYGIKTNSSASSSQKNIEKNTHPGNVSHPASSNKNAAIKNFKSNTPPPKSRKRWFKSLISWFKKLYQYPNSSQSKATNSSSHKRTQTNHKHLRNTSDLQSTQRNFSDKKTSNSRKRKNLQKNASTLTKDNNSPDSKKKKNETKQKQVLSKASPEIKLNNKELNNNLLPEKKQPSSTKKTTGVETAATVSAIVSTVAKTADTSAESNAKQTANKRRRRTQNGKSRKNNTAGTEKEMTQNIEEGKITTNKTEAVSQTEKKPQNTQKKTLKPASKENELIMIETKPTTEIKTSSQPKKIGRDISSIKKNIAAHEKLEMVETRK